MFRTSLVATDGRAPQHASRQIELLSLASAIFSATVGFLVVIGWASGIELLTRLKAEFPAMNPATAVCMLLSGSAIALHLVKRPRLAAVCGGLVAAAGTAKLLDIVVGGLPIDSVLFAGSLDNGLGPPNRMAPNTATALILLGMGLCVLASRRRALRIASQAFAVLALLISLFAIVGYGYGIDQLRGVGSFIRMALHTAVTLAIVSIAIFTLTPSVGLMVLLRDAGPAGSMIRTMLPLAAGIPIALGAVRLWGQHAGYYGTGSGLPCR